MHSNEGAKNKLAPETDVTRGHNVSSSSETKMKKERKWDARDYLLAVSSVALVACVAYIVYTEYNAYQDFRAKWQQEQKTKQKILRTRAIPATPYSATLHAGHLPSPSGK